MEKIVGAAGCADRTPQRGVPTSMCAGSAEWSSHVRSSYRKNSLQRNERTRGLKITFFFSNRNQFTQLAARLIDPACPPQEPDQVGIGNQAALCRIRS